MTSLKKEPELQIVGSWQNAQEKPHYVFAVFLSFFLDILFWSLTETRYWAKQNRLQIHLTTGATLIFSLHKEGNKFK